MYQNRRVHGIYYTPHTFLHVKPTCTICNQMNRGKTRGRKTRRKIPEEIITEKKTVVLYLIFNIHKSQYLSINIITYITRRSCSERKRHVSYFVTL